ncbi:MAG: hypothetical protein BMS9Abin33_0198 [Gammaproteobacteria bacterium]|nr:MAG: hypothetical protein BMS9Abin33_0198 [Gammaproteobacteria bacterium]
MTLRTRLVFAFTGSALLVLILFGLLVYQIAIDSTEREHTNWITHELKHHVQKMKNLANQDDKISPDKLLENLQGIAGSLYFITDDQGRIASGGLYKKQLLDLGRRVLLQAPDGHAASKGTFNFNGEKYYWGKITLDKNKMLYGVWKQRDEITPLFQSLYARMIAAAFIIFWIAVWGALIVSSMITRRLEKKNADFVHVAMHDTLTDLPNRNMLADLLKKAIQSARWENAPTALLVSNVNGFSEINNTLGHRAGDQILKAVATRLTSVVQSDGTVARLGADQFAILLPFTGRSDAYQYVEKINRVFDYSFGVDDMDIKVELTTGIVISPEHGDDVDALFRQAEVAMFYARKSGVEYSVYIAEQDPHDRRRLGFLGELRKAIQDNELTLHYQPKIDLKTQKTIGAEVLLRWDHPKYGIIQPDEFIPYAERSGLIRPLTLWVLNTALHQSSNWIRRGIDLEVSVNLSARNLQDTHLVETTRQLLEAWDVEPTRLELEITESAMMVDHVRAKQVLLELDALGINLAIDDFGTGYSSLAYLKSLPIDCLKIDKSFVMDLIHDKNDEVIVRSTIDLAHNLGQKVIAEGVESQEILDQLLEMKCDYAQGCYFSRPMPSEEVVAWLLQSPWGVKKKQAGGVVKLKSVTRKSD